jgi:hypothetical protein
MPGHHSSESLLSRLTEVDMVLKTRSEKKAVDVGYADESEFCP